MKSYLIIISIVISLLSPTKALYTAQAPDYLIYNEDTLAIFSNPLETYFQQHPNIKNPFSELPLLATGCWRGYIAYWELRNDSLFLKDIYRDKIKFDIAQVITDRDTNNDVFADWVNQDIPHPYGNLVYYIHDAYLSIYEFEKVFHLEAGILKSTIIYDNSKSRRSKYILNSNLLTKYIEDNIDYSKLPKIEKPIRVIVNITGSDNNGKINETDIPRKRNDIFDEEAIRIIKSIPEWDVIYKRGERYQQAWSIPVIFKPQEK